MRIGMIASNILPISKNVKKGTELFVYLFIKNLIKLHPAIKITLFASGDSQVLAKLISINKTASFNDPKIGKQHHKIFELALLSKAFQQQDQFDLYHAHIGNGEVVLPFAPFVKKPIVFTLHGELNKIYKDKYYALFKNLKNIYFISVSQTQRHPLPELNYYKTIYHGVDTYEFTFKPDGSGSILWVGRGIPEKGLEEVVEAVEKTKRPCQIFAIKKPNHLPWLMKIKEKAENSDKKRLISFRFDLNRENLIKHYQQAKLFLFPVNWEEPFGLVMIEAMACGTPVVAYARGSVPEVIKDGETGFIINSSENDIRGNWIVKKTGIDGLCEAVEKIYSMPQEQYHQMRRNCRAHVEKRFTIERMIEEYVRIYYQILDYAKSR